MFAVTGTSEMGRIGDRNAEASRKKLAELGIRILVDETGDNYGRTIELYCETGEFHIKAVGKPVKVM